MPFRPPRKQHFEPAATGVLTKRPAIGAVEPLDRRPAAALENPLQAVLGCVGDDQAVGGNGSHQVVKLRFDRREIRKNIRVIELEVVEDEGGWSVVDKF